MTSQLNVSQPDVFMNRAAAMLAAGAYATDGGVDSTAAYPLYVMDGLLEALEWANDGVASDEAACLWLASLRWYRAATGSFPTGAPEPLGRWIDEHAGRLPLRADHEALVQMLDTVDMPTRQNPHATGAGPALTLLGALIPGMLPHVTEATRRQLAVDAAALTGAASDFDAAAVLGPAVFELLCAEDPSAVLNQLAAAAPEDDGGRLLAAAASAAAAADVVEASALPAEAPGLTAALIGAARGTSALGGLWGATPMSALVEEAAARWHRLVFPADV